MSAFLPYPPIGTRASIDAMCTTVSVILGDDDPLVREVLLALLRDDDRLRVVGVAP